MVWISEGAADQSVVNFIETNNMKDRVVIDDASIEWAGVPTQLMINAATPSTLPTTLASEGPSSGKASAIVSTAASPPCGALRMLGSIADSLKSTAKLESSSSQLRRDGAIGRKSMNSGTSFASTRSGGQLFAVDKEMPGMA